VGSYRCSGIVGGPGSSGASCRKQTRRTSLSRLAFPVVSMTRCSSCEQISLRIGLADSSSAAARYTVSLRTLAHRVGLLRYSAGAASEARLLDAARTKTLTNFAELARELEWPHQAVRKMYWRLLDRGEWFPPLKYRAGRLLEIVCVQCGSSRWERPNRALALRTDRCFTCLAKRPRRRITIRCPTCGRTTDRWASAVKKLSNGASTVCRLCRVKAGIKKRGLRESKV